MRRVQVIRDVGQVRALRTPDRYRILGAIQQLGSCSVRDLAERLSRKPSSLYYHLDALVKAGLVRRAGSRIRGRKEEALYEASARDVALHRGDRSPRFLAAMWDAYRAVLAACGRNLERAVRSERHGRGLRSATMVIQSRVRLRPDDLETLREKVKDLHRFAAERDDPEVEPTVSLVSVWARIVEK